ncbi:MAG: hypothetical protein FD181_3783 [Prolixibacteraceae bacterium]|nr:MAG: hypothetical protein FD181_3783 [Prolixibacteraceae bacterium]
MAISNLRDLVSSKKFKHKGAKTQRRIEKNKD